MKNFLHIGVMRGGRLVDERYIPEKGEVSVGSAAKNTFALIGSNLPKEHALFSFRAKQPVLHIAYGAQGEIAIDGKTPVSIADLKAKGKATQAPKGHPSDQPYEGWELELPDTARGWVGFGDASFFFNIAPKPPPPPKNSLPVQVKTSFLSGVEKTFTAALLAILMLEGGGIAFVSSQPEIDVDKPAEEDLDRFAEIIMPDKKEEPKKDEEDEKKKAAEAEAAKKKAEEEAKKKAEEEAKKKDEQPKDEPKPVDAAAEAARKEALKKEVAKKGLLNVLGAAGGSGGALANVFAQSSGFGDDVEKALANTGGVKVAGAGEDAGARKGMADGGGGVKGVGDLAAVAGAGGGGGVALKEKPRVAAPQIQFDDGDIDVETSTVDKDSVARAVKARIKSVQQCYEKELKLNPTLKGKVVVRFVITTQGRVGDVSIDQNTMGNENVSACIMRLIKTWTFPIKPEEDSPVSFPFVFSPGG